MRYLVRVGENRYINLLNVTEICGMSSPAGSIRVRFGGTHSGPSSSYVDLTGDEATRLVGYLILNGARPYECLDNDAGIVDLLRRNEPGP